jgi:hypothetical protein
VVTLSLKDHGAEEVVVDAAVHDPFQVFDLAVSALHGAGGLGQGESVEDGGVVAAQTVGEGVQVGEVVCVHGCQPWLQVAGAGAVGEHFGERG